MTDLKAICKTLHLAHIIEEFEEVPFESKEQFLRDVLSIEVNSRQTTKIARLIKKAKFRELKWLRDYEWSTSCTYRRQPRKRESVTFVL